MSMTSLEVIYTQLLPISGVVFTNSVTGITIRPDVIEEDSSYNIDPITIKLMNGQEKVVGYKFNLTLYLSDQDYTLYIPELTQVSKGCDLDLYLGAPLPTEIFGTGLEPEIINATGLRIIKAKTVRPVWSIESAELRPRLKIVIEAALTYKTSLTDYSFNLTPIED